MLYNNIQTIMSKKVFSIIGFLIAGALLAAGLGFAPVPASAQFTINPSQPNCFSSEATGYVVTDCTVHAYFLGKPLENGKCYVSQATMAPSITASEVSCDTINAKTERDQEVQQENDAKDMDAEAKQQFTSRNDSVNCKGETPDKLKVCVQQNPVIQQFTQIINFLTIGVSVIITIVVIIGGMQYMTARNNPQAVTSAKKKIAAAIIAFAAYMILWAFLQYLIPGGVI